MIAELLSRLTALSLAASAAVLVALALRQPLRRFVGAQMTYRLWLLVPIAMLASLAPVPPIMGHAVAPLIQPTVETIQRATVEIYPAAKTGPKFDLALLVYAWLIGAAGFAAYLVAGQRHAIARFGLLGRDEAGFARAANSQAGPALVGLMRPQIVLPSDFEQRFAPIERELILAHERTHLAHGHLWINGLTALIRILNWFNPLVHWGAFHALVDQELACDAAVVERFPGERRTYAQALLKSQLDRACLPLGCTWPSRSPNLLQERLTMLAFKTPSRARLAAGGVLVVALCAGVGFTAWAAGPGEASSTFTSTCRGANCAPPRGAAAVGAAIKAGDVKAAALAGGTASDVLAAIIASGRFTSPENLEQVAKLDTARFFSAGPGRGMGVSFDIRNGDGDGHIFLAPPDLKDVAAPGGTPDRNGLENQRLGFPPGTTENKRLGLPEGATPVTKAVTLPNGGQFSQLVGYKLPNGSVVPPPPMRQPAN
jgi:beta-lactamase regulating signal transducer with metallopeptidase domain